MSNSVQVNSTGGDKPARFLNDSESKLSLLEKLKVLPKAPGCYLFKDKKGKVIYIGKAKNLQARVRSYFTNRDDGRYLYPQLINAIHDIEVILVENETEALILENNLIKQYKPKYNIDLKDDKIYPYLQITIEPFPQLFLSRRPKTKDSKYLGPFMDVKNMRLFIREVKKLFKIRTCRLSITPKTIAERKHKVCLQYHMKQCDGPCEGLISEGAYQEKVQSVINILNGRTSSIEEKWKNLMYELSNQKRYEEAAQIRDQLKIIQHISNRQRVLSVEGYDRDVLACYREDDECCVVVLRIRNGKMIGRLHYYLTNIFPNATEKDILSTFIIRLYNSADLPDEVIVFSENSDWTVESNALFQLKNKKVKIAIPKKDEQLGQCRLAYANAKLLMQERLITKEKVEIVSKTLVALQELLKLPNIPNRIECFDVSHLSGSNTVASLVVFQNGKPLKSEYRKYDIQSISKIDDFAAIQEVVFRRYRRLLNENKQLPDLVLIDGGKGQVNKALEALKLLQIYQLPVIGLAKRLEEIIIPNEEETLILPKSSSILRLLQQIRDEAHRFAIATQRNKRKQSIRTVLDDIKGIGTARRNALLKKFKSIEEILNADLNELAATIKTSVKQAENILTEVRNKVSTYGTNNENQFTK